MSAAAAARMHPAPRGPLRTRRNKKLLCSIGVPCNCSALGWHALHVCGLQSSVQVLLNPACQLHYNHFCCCCCCCRQAAKQEIKQVAEHKPPPPGEAGKPDVPKQP